jgi:asparagine synthase (glutamine-hydrolysing)
VILPPGNFRDDLPRAIEALEEPVGTSSAIGFREVSRLARAEVPVLLSGQGADELLGGYWRYVGEWIAQRALGTVGRLGLRRPAAALAARSRSARLERGLRALRYPETLERFMQIYAVFDPAGKEALYAPELASAVRAGGFDPTAAVSRYRDLVADRDPLAQMMFVDTRLWLPDDLLLVGDKMSMAESVEMRVPFLDRELVEFTESLPSDLKVRRGVRKVVEKKALEPLLPRSLVHRKERGFATPVDRWLRGPELQSFAAEVLLDPGASVCDRFRRDEIERLLDRHASGVADHTRQLYTLLSVELWGKRFLSVS